MIPLGVAVITDGEGAGGWSHQIAIVRRLRPELLRVRTPIGFGFSPARLQVLLESAPTIRTVLLCGEDGDVTPERTAADLERWLPLVDRFPQVRWVVELGNEPNLVGGLDIWEHRYYALMTLQRLPRQLGRPQLHWAISLPTTLAPSRDLLLHRDAHGCVADLVDAICPHLYGWHALDDNGGGQWLQVLDLARGVGKPVIISEAGIDDRVISRAEKARRYRDWVTTTAPRDLAGVCFWGLGFWPDNPTYEFTLEMADLLGARATSPVDASPQPITRATRVVGVAPRLSRAAFIQSLATSPSAAEAGAAYDAIVAEGVDPAFLRAVFRHESRDGTVGITPTYDTKSPGNTRTSATGVGTQVQTEKGPFIRYPSWVEGWRDAARRLVDPRYPYASRGATTIEQIVPIWAPPSDGNDPEAYIAAVVQDMNERIMAMSIHIPGLPVRVSHIPATNANRPGYPMTPQGVIIHETANRNVGANAEMHRRFTHSGGGSEQVSFHWVVDDREAIQLLPHTENAWHGGDGANGRCNRTRIAIEICVNADATWSTTLDNAARLTAWILRTHGWGIGVVEQHHHCSGKNCPMILRQGGWGPWLRQVEQYLAGEQPKPTAIYFPETGHWIAHGFKDYWERHGGLRVLGFPLTEEFRATDTQLVTQVFERYVLEWDPSAPTDWQVRGRHLVGLDLAAIVPTEAWTPRPAE